jgi:uncharacterized beta-barrel protein YwiB (DUF1934 family)
MKKKRMKKDVRITLEGMQDKAEKDAIEVRLKGTYQYQNGKHYIRYEEEAEDGMGRIKNTLKLSSKQVVMKKEGLGVNMQLTINPAEETQAIYRTPYGDLCLQISDAVILMTEEENEIRAILKYTLSDQGARISENQVKIRVVSL